MNIIITGASRGIGKAIAFAFAKEGFNMAVCSKNKNNLSRFVKEIKKEFPQIEIHALACDVSKKNEVLNFAKFVKSKFSKIDVLVNNAGIFLPGEIHKEKDEVIENLMAVNFYSAFHLTRALIGNMLKQKSGHIFNICSTASIEAYTDGGSYCISKHALYGFSKTLREEMKQYNIRVTSVLPGAVLTDSWRGTKLPKERFMKPEDIAHSILGAYQLSNQTVVEEIILRPVKGDI